MHQQEQGPRHWSVTLRASGWLLATGLLALLITTNCVGVPSLNVIETGTCSVDADCSDTQSCNLDGFCQPTRCSSNLDCTSSCNQPDSTVAGVCVVPQELVPCLSTGDCGAGQTCDTGRDGPVCVDNSALAVTTGFSLVVNGNNSVKSGQPLSLDLRFSQRAGGRQVSSVTIQLPSGAVLSRPFTLGAIIGTVESSICAMSSAATSARTRTPRSEAIPCGPITSTVTASIRADSIRSAFVDVNDNRVRDPGEAQFRVTVDGASVSDVYLDNHLGGDFNADQNVALMDGFLRVLINSGFRAGLPGPYLFNVHVRFEDGGGISFTTPMVVQEAVEALVFDADFPVAGPSRVTLMAPTGARVASGLPYQISAAVSAIFNTARLQFFLSPGTTGASYLAASPASNCTVLSPIQVECEFSSPGLTSTDTTVQVLVDALTPGTAFHFVQIQPDDDEPAAGLGSVISGSGPITPFVAMLEAPSAAGLSYPIKVTITSPNPLSVHGEGSLFASGGPGAASYSSFATMPPASMTITSPTPPQKRFDVFASAGPIIVNGIVQRTGPTFTRFDLEINGPLFAGLALGVGMSNSAAPTVTAFSPAAGAPVGTEVTISGTNLAGITEVRFNGVSAGAPVTKTATQIKVLVPAGATTGFITVVGPNGSAQSAAIFKVLPKITSVSPASGIPGDEVTINGSGFTGATEVAFGGVAATSFTVVSSTQITGVVSPGAKTGKITVKTAGGTASSPTDFMVIKPPANLVATPGAAAAAAIIVLTGGDLGTVTDVKFTMASTSTVTATIRSSPGRPTVSPVILSPTMLRVTVPVGAITGPITATNPAGSGQTAVPFKVIPVIAGFSPAAVIVGGNVSITGTSFTGATSVKFGTINAAYTVLSDGQITAVVPPGALGMVTVSVVTAGGTATKTLQVFGVLGIATTTLVPAQANVSYTQTLMPTGGRAPFSWSLFGGALPTGMNLSAAGVISGKSPTTGISTFTARVGDSLNQSATKMFNLTVNLGALTATCTPVAGEVGVPYNRTACVPKGGLPPYTCSLASGNASSGTTLNNDCSLSGTPTTAGTKTFMTRVADSGGSAVNVATTHVVLPAVQVNTTTLPAAKANTSYTTTLMASGGKLPYIWAIVSGNISPGYLLSPAGVLSGTSGVLGVRPFNVSVTDSLGGVSTRALFLTVNLGPLGATCTPAAGEVGVPYNQTACVPKLGLPPYSCSLASGNTSAGTTLNSDCSLSGTPTAAGTKMFTTRVADSGGSAVNIATTHVVLPAVQVNTTTLPAAKANTSYTTTLMASGGKLPYIWALVSGNISPGYLLSPAGVLSGSSGVLGVRPFNVSVTDSLGGVSTRALFLTVNLGPLAATCTPAAGEVGVPYNQTACVPKLGLPPYSCSLAGGNTSAGLTINSDCSYTGTPTAAGTKMFTTRVADSGGSAVNIATTHVVLPAVQVNTTTLPAAKANTSYTTTLAASGGKLPYIWTIVGGALPAGFNMSAAGVISGKSGVLGVSGFNVSVTDALGGVNTRGLSLAVNLGLLAATCTPATGEVGVPYNQTACMPTLGLPPYSCSLAGGNTSAGLTINSDCSYTGTPTAGGTKMFTTRVADSGGSAVNVATTHMVLPAVQITTLTVPAAKANTSYTTTLIAAGGKAPYGWSVVSGNLSPNLALAPATGVLSGIATALGINDVIFRATDALGGVDDQLLRLVTNLGPLGVTCLPKLSSANASYSTTCPATGGLPPYSCALNSGTPPAGINVNADCTVTGVPTAVGSKTFSVRATDSANASATTNLTINVAAAAGVATTSLLAGKVGVAYSATLQFKPSVSPYTWAIVGGTLPPNIVLNMNTGALTGTPTVAGAFPITVQVTDGAGGTGTKDLTLTINP